MSEWWFGERPGVRGTEEESTWGLNSSLERPGESFLLLAEVDPKVGPEVSGEKSRNAIADLSLYLLDAKNGKGERMNQKPLASLASLARTHFGCDK